MEQPTPTWRRGFIELARTLTPEQRQASYKTIRRDCIGMMLGAMMALEAQSISSQEERLRPPGEVHSEEPS